MSDPSNPASLKTLGQRIDAVLQPLYTEGEQHRTTLNLIKAQIKSLEEQADAAMAGLAQIESRMAQVVCSLAEHEPIIAAVVTGQTQTPATPPPAAAAPTATPTPQPIAIPATPEPVAAAAPEPVAVKPAASVVAEGERVPLDLDPEVDEAMVKEASSLLAGEAVGQTSDADEVQAADEPQAADEAQDEGEAEAEPELAIASSAPTSIAAVAERAAAAAKELREKAGSED